MANILLNDNLESLNSHIYYRKFDNWANCYYNPEFLDSVVLELDGTYNLKDVSSSLVKALCYIKNLQLRSDFESETCDYLYYWLGDKIFNHLSEKDKFSSLIDQLYAKLKDLYNNNKCKIITSNINENNFRKIKDVYDYKKNYGTIEKAIQDYGNTCSKEFRKYLDKSYESYEELYETCKTCNEEHCKQLKKIFSTYPNDKLKKLECTVKEAYRAQGADEHLRATVVNRPLDGSLSSGGGHLDSEQHMLFDPSGVPSAAGGSDMFMGIFFPFVGILIVFYLLYKFTPIGLKVNSFLRKKRIISRNIDDIENLELMDNIAEDEEKDTQRSLFNIPYPRG
ncbi:Plasmodium vivax Vir protein, putative [Plasmodium ovale]|uniref:Plasmodium vivax Vir protein, putative n=1 Tax=Plasmodium ovale TaxID=36330 RepID=A0A1C3KJC3_PLAOA|nr:Plasmodium vivax Vir protein, putative [Plasmodium ovale]